MKNELVEDFQKDGLWVKYKGWAGVNDCQITLAARYWYDARKRCKPNGFQQKKFPQYIGCTMSESFLDFQKFATWCQWQIGYGNKGWHIDKDLIVRGNKVYSEDTCVFLPPEINTLIINSRRSRGDYPVGVHKTPRGKFIAQCQIGTGEGQKYLGQFDTPEEAFAAYKKFKEALIKERANRFKEVIDPRAYKALMEYEVRIDD